MFALGPVVAAFLIFDYFLVHLNLILILIVLEGAKRPAKGRHLGTRLSVYGVVQPAKR